MSATLTKVFGKNFEILAKAEYAADSVAQGSLVKADTTNWPAGFPRGLVMVETTEGGESGFLDPYLTTPLAIPLFGTWTDDTDVDSSTITDDTIKGTTQAKKFELSADIAAADLIATQVVTAQDLSGADFVIGYVKSSIALDSGDVQIGFSATATLGGSPVFDDIPAIPADVWFPVAIPVASLPSVNISFGLKLIVDKGAFDIYLNLVTAFTADTSNAAVGVIKDDVVVENYALENINGETGYKAAFYTNGHFFKTPSSSHQGLLGLDAGAISDLGAVSSANDTEIKF